MAMLFLRRTVSLCKCARLTASQLRTNGTNEKQRDFGQVYETLRKIMAEPDEKPGIGFGRGLAIALSNTASESKKLRLGPDLACAEWLVTHGAWIRWKGATHFTTHPDELPNYDGETGLSLIKKALLRPSAIARIGRRKPGVRRGAVVKKLDSYVLEEVCAMKSDIMLRGFSYFEGCKGIKRLVFADCDYLDDECIEALGRAMELRDSLEHLEILCCEEITVVGIQRLMVFRNLKYLNLVDLPNVMAAKNFIQFLAVEMPDCKIEVRLIGQED